MAEAIFNHRIKEMGLSERVTADSCGTANYHIGDLPDRRTVQVVKKNGITINHRGRQLNEKDMEDFDYVIAMDRSNHKEILRLVRDKNLESKVSLMCAFGKEDGDEVPDPYYGDENDFQQVFDMLDRTIGAFVEHLKKEHFKA
jgi:protein-tyrosine phosphatase